VEHHAVELDVTAAVAGAANAVEEEMEMAASGLDDSFNETDSSQNLVATTDKNHD